MNASASTQFFTYFDWTATFLWAASGALLAARRGYDILGIAIIALVSACGGGLLRDGIFLQNGPPLVVRSPVYLGLVGIATLAVVIFGRHLRGSRSFYRVVTIVNAIGLGAYAVVGMNLAIAANLPVFGVIFVGTVNAVGGSVLRDILMGDLPPMLFRPSVLLGLVSLAGCVLFEIFIRCGIDKEFAGLLTVALVFSLRLLALRFNVSTKPLTAFEEDWRQADNDQTKRW